MLSSLLPALRKPNKLGSVVLMAVELARGGEKQFIPHLVGHMSQVKVGVFHDKISGPVCREIEADCVALPPIVCVRRGQRPTVPEESMASNENPCH
jgi:hypothetical protein